MDCTGRNLVRHDSVRPGVLGAVVVVSGQGGRGNEITNSIKDTPARGLVSYVFLRL